MGSSPPKPSKNPPPPSNFQPPGGPPNYKGMEPPNSQNPRETPSNQANLPQNYPGQQVNSQYPPSQQQIPSSMPQNYSRISQNQPIAPGKQQMPGNPPPNYPAQNQNLPYPQGGQPMTNPLPNNPNEIYNSQYPSQYGNQPPSNYSPHNPNINQSFGPDQRSQNFKYPYTPNPPFNQNMTQNYGNTNPHINPSQQAPGAYAQPNPQPNYPANPNNPQYPPNYPNNINNPNVPNQNNQYLNPSSQHPSNVPNQNQMYAPQGYQNPPAFSNQTPSNPSQSQYPPNMQTNNQPQVNNLPFQNNPPSNQFYSNQNSNQPMNSQNQSNIPGQFPYTGAPTSTGIPTYPPYSSQNNYRDFPPSYPLGDPLYSHEVVHLSNPIPSIPYSDVFSHRIPTEYEINSPIRSMPIERIITPPRSITPPLRRYISPPRVITHTSIPEIELPSAHQIINAPRIISSRIIPTDYPADIVQDSYLNNRLNMDIVPPSYHNPPRELDYPLNDFASQGRLVSRQILDTNIRENRYDYLPSKTFSPTRIQNYTPYKNYEVPIAPNLEANYPLVGGVQQEKEYLREPPMNYANEKKQIQNIPRGTLVNFEYPSIKVHKKPIQPENENIEKNLSGGNKTRMG